MAINKKLISFATQIQFDNQLSAGDIDNRSIVFIEDKKRIWTHGVYFDTLWDHIQNKPSTLDGYGITDAYTKTEVNSLASYVGAYSFSNGFLVKTNVARTENSMLVLHIKGNSYGGLVPINTFVQVYNYRTSDAIIQTGALNNGYRIDEVKAFYYDNLVYFWVPQQTSFMTMTFQLLKAEGQVNRVDSVTNAVVPTSGVEKMVTIIPRTAWFENTLTNLSQLTDNMGIGNHITNKSNPHAVTKAQVGLGSVDNTADSAKNVLSATKLTTARTINGVSFNGSADITITAATPATLTRGSYLTGSNFNGSTATTWAVDATSANTASKVVARDVSGNFSAGIITASLSGNASSATYASAVTLTADNTTNATRYPLFVSAATGNLSPRTDTGFTYNPSTGELTATGFIGALSGNASTASTAAKVNNKLILKFDTGTTENTNLYTYDGSAAKTIDIKAGSNVSLTKAANTITISSVNTVYTHPTTDGNKHVPATGTTNNGKVLKAGSTAGSISWGNVAFSEITSRPTTLSGYGITDAVNTNKLQVVTELPSIPESGVFYFIKE